MSSFERIEIVNQLIKVLGCEAIRVRKTKGDRKPAVSGKYTNCWLSFVSFSGALVPSYCEANFNQKVKKKKKKKGRKFVFERDVKCELQLSEQSFAV